MTNQELFQKIDAEVTAICRDRTQDQTFSNNVAKVLYAGEMCAKAHDCNFVGGEGYPKAYYDWNLIGMQNALAQDYFPKNVHAFYAKFFG